MTSRSRIPVLMAILAVGVLFLLMPVSANTLTVTNLDDSGAGSLRQAILNAEGGDTITFDNSLADSTITLSTGELVITKVLTIASTIPITVSGNNSSQVITTSAALTLTGFTISEGSAATDGGGVYAWDSLFVQNMNFINNASAISTNGGAIYVVGALTVDRSSFLGNSTWDSGGAIHASGAMTITRSTFLDNQAVIGAGGAIAHRGIGQIPTTSDGQIINSVFARNSINDGSNAYGIYLGSTGHVDLIHNTIVGDINSFGSAITVDGGSATISNTMVVSYETGIDVSAGTVIEDFNLFNNVSQELSPAATLGTSDRTDTTGNNNPGFVDPAADDYHLLTGSDAIDNGQPSNVTDDHDGTLRDAAPDIGAFESPFGAAEISVDNVSIDEGNSGTTVMAFPLTLSTAKGVTVTVDYTITAGSATNGSDFTATLNGVVSFAPGEVTTTVDVDVLGDLLVESAENVTLNLGNPQFATLFNTQATGTILNDDSARVAVSNPSVQEGNSGTTNLVFTVSLDNPADFSFALSYASDDGTATTTDSDYDSTSGQMNFAAGELSQLITVTVHGDTKIEADETLTLTVDGEVPFGIIVGRTGQSGIGTILNDDSPTPTPTLTPTVTRTPTPTNTPTATPPPALHLQFTSIPPGGTAVQPEDTISYTLILSNSGGIATNVALSVVIPSGVTLIPSSVQPTDVEAALVSGVNDSNQEADTTLSWQIPTLATGQSFTAQFAVVVGNIANIFVPAQGGIVGGPPLTASLSHPVVPTGLNESKEPPPSSRLFLPLVTSSQ